MRLRTTLGTAAAVVGLGVLSFGGVSLAQTGGGESPEPAESSEPAAEAPPAGLDAAWESLDACLGDEIGEPTDGAGEDEWEAFEAAADTAWDECVSSLPPEQQTAIEADEAVWAAFEECLDASVDWSTEPSVDIAESEWRAFDEQIFAAEKACADQLPADAQIEFGAGIADEEAWMAFDQCISEQGAPTSEPALDAPHSGWMVFDGAWEVAEEACIDLLPDEEWCDEDHEGHTDEPTEPGHDQDGEEHDAGEGEEEPEDPDEA